MNEHVVITVRCDDAPSPSKAPNDRIVYYAVLMLRSFLICFIAGKRIQWANQSAFDNNRVFTNTSIVASYGTLVLHVVLMAKDDNDYANLLKFIGSCLAFLGPFSLLMVMVLPGPELNWIGYSVTCVMLGIIVTCFYVDDQQEFRPYIYNDLALVFVPIFTVATALFPARSSLNWVMYWVIYVCLRMENGYHLISCALFIYMKTRKLGARSRLITMIRQEEYDIGHPPYLSYMMPLRNPPSF